MVAWEKKPKLKAKKKLGGGKNLKTFWGGNQSGTKKGAVMGGGQREKFKQDQLFRRKGNVVGVLVS